MLEPDKAFKRKGLPQRDFISVGKHYYWMSIEEMETDPCIKKCNSDVVNFVKEMKR